MKEIMVKPSRTGSAGPDRRSDPRRMGLLSPVDPAVRERPRRLFPYGLGDRISGDLTVIGHLAVGRVGHLYQVWSASEWSVYTCKILAPYLADDRGANAALRREGRILRRLSHPNIVQIFREGEHDGLPFLLMEYLDGPSMFSVMESRPSRQLLVADAVRAAVHVGAGLYHLHRAGLVHLDMKPANLLLRASVPVLVDFDVARRIDPSRRPRSPRGTPPYMAPEYVRCEPPGPEADIYGLAAVLYELITGRWPYEDVYTDAEEREGREREFPQLGASMPAPPSSFNAGVSPTLDQLILRCLAHDPAERFSSLHNVLLGLSAELEEPAALWPRGVLTERRREPRE